MLKGEPFPYRLYDESYIYDFNEEKDKVIIKPRNDMRHSSLIKVGDIWLSTGREVTKEDILNLYEKLRLADKARRTIIW